MKAINVITFHNGILQENHLYLSKDESTDDVTALSAEQKFRREANEIANEPISDEDMQIHLDSGSFDNQTGREVIITWPEIHE